MRTASRYKTRRRRATSTQISRSYRARPGCHPGFGNDPQLVESTPPILAGLSPPKLRPQLAHRQWISGDGHGDSTYTDSREARLGTPRRR